MASMKGQRGRRSVGWLPAGRWRGAALVGLGLLVVLAGLVTGPPSGAGQPVGTSRPVPADGPAPCTVGPPPFPYAGFCATYSGANTWYGSYGPGFPTPTGWAFCADPPASGGDYPAPAYGYVASGPPAQADTTDLDPLGFAFSQAQAEGWWGGATGQFTADQAAVAGKLLYDEVVWGSPLPAMDPGVLAAYDALDHWYTESVGATGPPQLSTGLEGGGTTMGSSATDDIHLQFPGTGRPVVGLGVLLHVTNGSFGSAGGPTSIGVSTDTNGNALVPVFAAGSGTVTVTVVSTTEVGQPAIGFERATSGPPNTQDLADFSLPIPLASTQVLTATLPPPDGTVSVTKSGDDTAYYGLAGALFDVEDAGGVVAQLETGADGTSPPSGPLPDGTYLVHEQLAPPGYLNSLDRTVTVVGGTNTVVAYTGVNEERIMPGQLIIHKVDAGTGVPLAGAVFDVAYDAGHDGSYDDDLGHCTTGAAGTCSPPGDDGPSELLAGDYRVTETTAPPGYAPTGSPQLVTVLPGQTAQVTFSDVALGALEVVKSGDDTAYQSVTGAVFTVTGPAPASTVVGHLTVGPTGASNILADLLPGTYTVTETTPPPGYQAIAAVTVAVTAGPETTTLDVLDHVQPGQIVITKTDAETAAPLAGALFDLRYDPSDDGSFVDVGRCTTTASGQCSPPGNDAGGGLLPGDYQVTEVAPPAGYAPATPSVQALTLEPGATATAAFADPELVAASFQKVATGNVDPAQVVYAGAVIDVTAGTPGGAVVAGCTTAADGACTTAATLVAGAAYCWSEPVAPPGLAPASGACFVATDAQAARPITVSDPGRFVAVAVAKVDAAAPSVGLAGAVMDLFRMDGGRGPDSPPAPAGAPTLSGGTWVGQATTAPGGRAAFALQFPGYAYCVVEQKPPTNYAENGSAHCTGVLDGTTTVPAPVTTVTVDDTEALVTLEAHKFNSASPDTGIPGATYDLYVEGPPPPAGVPTPAPSNAVAEPGDTWYGRGTTDGSGQLAFTVPSGFAWCLPRGAGAGRLRVRPGPALHGRPDHDVGPGGDHGGPARDARHGPRQRIQVQFALARHRDPGGHLRAAPLGHPAPRDDGPGPAARGQGPRRRPLLGPGDDRRIGEPLLRRPGRRHVVPPRAGGAGRLPGRPGAALHRRPDHGLAGHRGHGGHPRGAGAGHPGLHRWTGPVADGLRGRPGRRGPGPRHVGPAPASPAVRPGAGRGGRAGGGGRGGGRSDGRPGRRPGAGLVVGRADLVPHGRHALRRVMPVKLDVHGRRRRADQPADLRDPLRRAGLGVGRPGRPADGRCLVPEPFVVHGPQPRRPVLHLRRDLVVGARGHAGPRPGARVVPGRRALVPHDDVVLGRRPGRQRPDLDGRRRLGPRPPPPGPLGDLAPRQPPAHHLVPGSRHLLGHGRLLGLRRGPRELGCRGDPRRTGAAPTGELPRHHLVPGRRPDRPRLHVRRRGVVGAGPHRPGRRPGGHLPRRPTCAWSSTTTRTRSPTGTARGRRRTSRPGRPRSTSCRAPPAPTGASPWTAWPGRPPDRPTWSAWPTGPPLAPTAALSAQPPSGSAPSGGGLAVTVSPSFSGFVGAGGPDSWTAAYSWTCQPVAGAPGCAAAAPVSVPPADQAGTFDGPVAADLGQPPARRRSRSPWDRGSTR